VTSATLLAFDFGERRIGVAVGETATGIANPLDTIDAAANDARFAAIEKLVREWNPQAFVVGVPRHADGSPHPVARLAEKFARRLTALYGAPVHFVDETLTSAEAQSALREMGAGSGDVDALAAALILQSYLDARKDDGRVAS
jgi:putative Holliday junction resolvase